MLIAQISDTHLAGWGKKTFGIAPMAENLARCVTHINNLNPQPDIVLVTGDVSNNGTADECERAADILGNLNCPFYVIPGNHDNRETLVSVFGKKSCPAEAKDFVNYTIEGYPIHLIALDSTIPTAPGGEICESRARWLDNRLQESVSKPVIIFMHHPPIKFGVAETDIDGFIGADRLGSIIEKYDNIERILCGHIHLPALAKWRGTVISTAPSIGMRLLLDLTLELPSCYILEEPSYQLHYQSKGNKLVTHTVIVRENEKIYPFETIEINPNQRK